MKKIIYALNLLVLFILVGCGIDNPSIDNSSIKSINITNNNQVIEELNVLVGDQIQLTVQVEGEGTPSLVWESSDQKVATVDTNGKVVAAGRGTVVITVALSDRPFINDSIIIKCSNKVEQTGVGSGLTPNDPIFLGNEGEDEPIEVYFIEMQHIYADSIYIKKGNVDILIDAGYEYDGKNVNKFVNEHCTDDRLDLFMVSHSDGDHVDGITQALKDVDNISLMVDYGGVGSGNVLATRNKYTQKGMVYHSAYDCVNKNNGATDIYYLTKDFYFEVLNTGEYIKNDGGSASNPHSVAVIFYYKNFTFFTAGDITTATEEKLLKNEDLPEVTLYKASHHGSHGSNSQDFLDTLNPKAVAISAARANQYQMDPSGPKKENTYNLNGASGHPAAEAIKRIYKAPNISQNLNVYWSAINGTMKFTSYGNNDFDFQGSPTQKGYYDLTLTNGVGVWDDSINDFKNKVTGEENLKLHETKVFTFRNYYQYLPEWYKN